MRLLRATLAVLAALALAASACSALREALELWIMDGTHHDPAAFFEEATTDHTEWADIPLNIEYVPWSEARARLATAAREGTPPDVAEVGTTWTSELASSGVLLDLTDRLDDPRRYIPELMVSGTHTGRIYGVPWHAGIRALVYRTDVLDGLGLEAPGDWSELRAVALAVDREHDMVGFPVPGDAEHALTPFLWGAEGGIARDNRDGTWEIRIDSEASRRGLAYYTDLAVEHGVSPADAVHWNEVDVADRFAEGEIAMALLGNWTVAALAADDPSLARHLGAVPVPGPEGEPSPSFVGGSHLVVFDGTGREDDAWRLVERLTGADHAARWAQETGYLPGPRDALGPFLRSDDPLVAPFVTQLDEAAATYPVTPAYAEVQEQEVLQTMLKEVLGGQASVDEATAAAAEELDRILNED